MTAYLAALTLANGWHMDGFGWWWVPMVVGMILFWGLVIVGIVWVARGGLGLGPPAAGRMSALDILERRLAEGDLTVEEYRERRDALTGWPGAGS